MVQRSYSLHFTHFQRIPVIPSCAHPSHTTSWCLIPGEESKTVSLVSVQFTLAITFHIWGPESLQQRIESMHFMHMFFVLNQEQYVFFCFENTPILGAETSRKGFKLLLSSSPSVYPGRHQHHPCDKMDQAFPLRLCILQAIKNRAVEGCFLSWR